MVGLNQEKDIEESGKLIYQERYLSRMWLVYILRKKVIKKVVDLEQCLTKWLSRFKG